MIRLLLLFMLLFFEQISFSQVGIGTTAPDAQLDIRSSNQSAPTAHDGILIPKIDAFPAVNPTSSQDGMMVYLTTTSGLNLPGFYYWSQTASNWISIGGTQQWSLNGNSATNPVSNFLGTKDNQSLIIKTNDTERLKIDNTGKIGVGGVNPTYPMEFKSIVGDKICLYNTGPSKSYGFGIDNSLLQIFSSNPGSSIGFGFGSSLSFTENVRFTGWGDVGIGTSNPQSKLHIRNGNSTMTPNINALATLENSGSSYLNILSGTESGILFGANSTATNGGILYNTPGYTDCMQFRTSGNTLRMVLSATGNMALGPFMPTYPLHFSSTTGDKISLWGGLGNHYGLGVQGGLLQIHSATNADDIAFGFGESNAFNERMRIKGNGNVGIGTNPNFPLHFSDQYGDKIALYGNSGNHYGIGIQSNLFQIHTPTTAEDIVFGSGNSAAFTEKMRIKGTGEVGIGTSTPTAELEVNGFTKLGSNAPAVKMIKLTGTTGATQGNSTFIAHGVSSNKILSVNVMVEYTAGNFVPPSYNGSIGYEYDYYITTTSVVIWTKSSNSSSILSKPIRVLVTYEE